MLKEFEKYEQLLSFRCIVKNFLGDSGLVIPSFKDNAPGPDWERYFIKVRKIFPTMNVKLMWG